MKKIKYIALSLFTALLITSCDEQKFLEPKPLDFLTSGNALITLEDFQASVNSLYNDHRQLVWDAGGHDNRYTYHYATDFAHNSTDYYVPQKLNAYEATMVPEFGVIRVIWEKHYAVISRANIVLARIEKAAFAEEKKNILKGEALFIRAHAYRTLAHLYGGVPLYTEEITTSKKDFVRATRDEVYEQCEKDFTEAASLLPDIESVIDGKLNKQVAKHLLCEILISRNKHQEAINTATEVINHPACRLITERFGSMKDKPGDVYFDLFRVGNQNRKSAGNTEALFVLQYDYLNPASNSPTTLPWALGPGLSNIKLSVKNETPWQAFKGRVAERGADCIGWIQPTPFFFNQLWDDPNDIRNSEYNIIRDFKVDNDEAGEYNGKWFVKDGIIKSMNPRDTIRNWYPLITKTFPIGQYPEGNIDKAGGKTSQGYQKLLSGSNRNYKDEYQYRLAETYLLRAEAYIGIGNPAKAAEDINIIRERAKAAPVDASKVNMDYLLDERLRELYTEELRMVTLTRTGKLYERNVKYNPVSGKTIKEYHNLWPIPYEEIERNDKAVLTQNPGYPQK